MFMGKLKLLVKFKKLKIMYYNQSQIITMSLLNKLEDVDSSTGKILYEKTSTVKFNYDKELFSENVREELFSELLASMYKDLLHNVTSQNISLGLWVTFGDLVFENAIDTQVLDDIKIYGEKGIEPIVEFYKMTIEFKE